MQQIVFRYSIPEDIAKITPTICNFFWVTVMFWNFIITGWILNIKCNTICIQHSNHTSHHMYFKVCKILCNDFRYQGVCFKYGDSQFGFRFHFIGNSPHLWWVDSPWGWIEVKVLTHLCIVKNLIVLRKKHLKHLIQTHEADAIKKNNEKDRLIISYNL